MVFNVVTTQLMARRTLFTEDDYRHIECFLNENSITGQCNIGRGGFLSTKLIRSSRSCARILPQRSFRIKRQSMQQIAISLIHSFILDNSKATKSDKKTSNMLSIKSIISITFAVLLIFTISSSVDAFKKLPMNGSMFGKRGTSIGN